MGINNNKYVYINRVALVRGSWALQKFEEDAAKHHMEDQPGKLAALRLTEYYELLERLQQGQPPALASLPVVGGVGEASPVQQTPSSALNGTGHRTARRVFDDGNDDEPTTGAAPQDDSFDDDVDDQWDM
jgi:hypothetical protein